MRYFLLNKGTSDTPRPKGSYPIAAGISCLLLILSTGCKSSYRNLRTAPGDVNCIKTFTPKFDNTLYSAYVDVTKHHFSGLLFFKRMPDSSMRIVFTNEIGVKFFDFAFDKNGAFTKHYILAKMDKKPVVKALKNDMELVLLQQDLSKAIMLRDSIYSYVAIPTEKGNNYYITDNCKKLIRIEKSSKRKAVVQAYMLDYKKGIPDSINIHHRNFKFNIALKRAER